MPWLIFTLRKLLLLSFLYVPYTAVMAGTPQPLVVSTWDGYLPDQFAELMSQQLKRPVSIRLHKNNQVAIDSIISTGGLGIDIVFVSSQYAELLNNLQMASQLDHQLIPNLSHLYPEARQLAHDPNNQYSVPYAWGTTGICYRADMLSAAPKSWNDLLEPAESLKGRLTLLSNDRWMLAAGLKAKGLSLNSHSENDIDAALDLIADAKENLLGFDDSLYHERLVTGQVVMSQAIDAWCNYGRLKNTQVMFANPVEGGGLWVDTVVVLNSSRLKDDAHQFINTLLEAEHGKHVVEKLFYKSPNAAANQQVDAKLTAVFPNLTMTAAELAQQEQVRFVGNAQTFYEQAALLLKQE